MAASDALFNPPAFGQAVFTKSVPASPSPSSTPRTRNRRASIAPRTQRATGSGPATSTDPAYGSGAVSGGFAAANRSRSGSASTPNTNRVQDTGLGPSTLNPDADSASDPNASISPFAEIGSAGLAQYGGFVRDEFLPQLQGDRGLRVFREMYDNDPIVGALVFTIQMLLRKVEWRVEPPRASTVEGIAAARQQERMQMMAERRQEQQAQLMAAQSGLAQGGGAGASSMRPDGSPGATPTPQPRPAFATPNASPDTTPFHEPLPGMGQHPATSPPGVVPNGTPVAGPLGHPQPHPAGSGSMDSTPDNMPGRNGPSAATSPSTNFPARPNGPNSNPGGGPNQSGALQGNSGLPGSRPPTPGPVDPGGDTEIGGLPKRPLAPISSMLKASSGGGQMSGDIEALDVGSFPTDPETGEQMDFPVGTDPLAPPSPEELHALELAVFVETALHDMADSWADTISQIITMIVYGFALHETVYKKRNGPNPDDPTQGSRFSDGRIGWAKIAGRAQETRHRWEFDEYGNVLGMWQMAPPKFQLKYIPMSKALLFRTTGYKQNPEGRALALDTPIPTPDGWRIMSDLVEGDPVFGSDGRVRYVTGTQTWENRPAYRITFSDGSFIDADKNHQWITTKVWERSQGRSGVVRTTADIAATVRDGNGVSNHGIAWAAPVRYPKQFLPIDPWVLGLWLGDGTTLSGQIACHVDDALETASLIEQAGYSTKTISNGTSDGNGRQIQVYGLSTDLRSASVLGDKHVPEEYLRGDVSQRTALLSGLMDSDGTVDKDGRCEFTNTNMLLVDGVAELVRSLGMSCRVSLRKRANGASHKQDSWCVKFTTDLPVFRLSRKIARIKPVRARRQHYIVSVEPIEPITTKCIEVDAPDHLYLAGTAFVPTHNSVLRSAYRPWYFKRRIEEIEAIGVERDLAGIPVAYVPYQWMSPFATPDEQAALGEVKEIVKNIRMDEQAGLVLPSIFDPESKQQLFKLELMSAGTGGSKKNFDTDKIISRYDQRIAMVALIDFILLGHESVGSKALADTKTDLFTSALEAWLNVIADVFNTFAIPRLMQMNGEDPAGSPTLTFGKLSRVSMTEIAAMITALAAAGADLFPDAALEDSIREMAGLPPKEASDDL